MSSDHSPAMPGKTGRHNRCWVSAMPIVILLGCGGPETTRVPLVRVSGVVTLDGEPLAKAVVVFESLDGSFAYAQTDSRGRYDLMFDSQSRGTTVGKKTVRISMNRRIRGLNSNDEGGPGDIAGGAFEKQPSEQIPEEYNVRSILHADVTASTKTFNFDLVSEPHSKFHVAAP